MSQRRGQGWRSKCLKGGVGVALAGGVLLSAGAAHASGFSVARFGSEHGTPMTTNGTSLYYNPGGFAASDGTHVFIDITAAWRTAGYQHTVAPTDYSESGAADGDIAREANTHDAKLFNVIPSPSAFVTTKIGDLGLALGFFTPFGGAAKWGKNDDFEGDAKYQGLYDGGQRWYTIDGQLRTSYLSLGVGYHLKDAGLSFGVAGNALISLVQTLRARNADGSDNINREGRTYLDASSLDWSIGLGVRWAAPDDKIVIGASWQSAPNIDGKMRFEGTLTNVYGPEDALAGGTSGDTDFTGALPNVFRLGGEYKVDETLSLRLFGDYQNWSVLDDHCVVAPGGTCDIQEDGTDANGVGTVNQPRNWDDTFGVRAGASYFLDDGDGPELFAGLGFASNAIPDEYLEPALMDFDALTPVAGARFKIADGMAIAASYTQVIYFSRDTSGKSVLAGKQPPSRGPDAGGKYSQAVGVLNVNADFQF